MKKLVVAAFVAFGLSQASAQAPLEQGGLQLNAGVGLSNWGVPVYVGLDYGIHPDITIGAVTSYRNKKENDITYTAFSISGNANYHFNRVLNIPSNFDFYAGASLGYYNWSYDAPQGFSNYAYKSGIGASLQVGGRYFFTENFGLNLEVGGGSVSGGNFGITYKF